MQLEERSKYSTLNDYYAEPSEQQTASGERSSQQSMEGERKGVDTSPSEAVDVQLTKRDSHHFLASLTLSGSSIEDSSPLNKVRHTILTGAHVTCMSKLHCVYSRVVQLKSHCHL